MLKLNFLLFNIYNHLLINDYIKTYINKSSNSILLKNKSLFVLLLIKCFKQLQYPVIQTRIFIFILNKKYHNYFF